MLNVILVGLLTAGAGGASAVPAQHDGRVRAQPRQLGRAYPLREREAVEPGAGRTGRRGRATEAGPAPLAAIVVASDGSQPVQIALGGLLGLLTAGVALLLLGEGRRAPRAPPEVTAADPTRSASRPDEVARSSGPGDRPGGLRVLFVEINPALSSAEVGHQFASPGNRFRATLHAAGWTWRRLRLEEDAELPQHGIGVTEIVARPTRAAAELTEAELREGAAELERTVREQQPRLVAIVGLTGYRTTFERPLATVGLQLETIGGRPVWVLPNPSGLSAHYKPARLAELYAEARRFADAL